MKYKRIENEFYIRLDDGDDLMGSLVTLCTREGVTLGYFQGFGGIAHASLGIWNNGQDAYDTMEANAASMEALAILGNITLKDGQPMIHCHTVISDNSFRTFGGHLFSGTIRNMAELVLSVNAGRIDRMPFKKWLFMDL